MPLLHADVAISPNLGCPRPKIPEPRGYNRRTPLSGQHEHRPLSLKIPLVTPSARGLHHSPIATRMTPVVKRVPNKSGGVRFGHTHPLQHCSRHARAPFAVEGIGILQG